MQPKRKTTALVLTGAVAVASAGYGIGSQADSGSAVADGGSDRRGPSGLMFERGSPPGFENLADTLGVDATELREALRDFHEQKHGDHRDEFAAELAKALQIPVEKVTAALEQTHDRLQQRFEGRGERPGRAHRHHHVMPLRQLASALDVSRAELRQALREIRPDRAAAEDRFEEHQQVLAKFLAERLDLDVEKVTDALANLPRSAPHPHGPPR